MHPIRLLSILISLLLPLLSQNALAFDPYAQLWLDRLSVQLQAGAKVPGGAIAIVSGRTIQTKSFGQRGLQDARAVDSNTVFRIASLSKTFTGALAAIMVADGSIQWQSPVRKALPALRFAKASTNNALQLSHLLSHSTGVLPYAFDQQLETPSTKLAAIIPQFPKAPIVCQPGQCYGYQNSLFSMAALMLEKQSGKPFDDMLQQRIFTPLAMRNSSVGFANLQAASNLALPHIQSEGRWQQVPLSTNFYAAAPAAGINSSVADMGIWLAAQMGAHPQVLSDDSLEALRKPRVRADKFADSRHWQTLLTNEYYGLGWRVLDLKGETLMFHAGWVKGYSAMISYAPKHQTGVVVLLNAERWLNSTAVEFWCEVLSVKTGKSLCPAQIEENRTPTTVRNS
jgi:beta-lactamase class C